MAQDSDHVFTNQVKPGDRQDVPHTRTTWGSSCLSPLFVTWLYDEQVPSEVWIVKQDFEYHYEEDFSDGPELLNSEGEAYQVVIARNGEMIGLGPSRLSLADAVSAAEEVITTGVVWTNHVLQRLYGGRYYCTTPTPKDLRA
jgi:hypothetical protein